MEKASCHKHSNVVKILSFRQNTPMKYAQQTVLVLNRQWQAINTSSPMAVFGQMMTDAATGLDIREDGAMEPVQWDQWVTLPIGPDDEAIGTPRGLVRVPRVVVLASYAKVPLRRPKLTKRGIRERDKGCCQYTGRKLQPHEVTVDHVIPRCKGGGTSWENLVLSCKNVNSRKGGRTPQEAGLRLLSNPRAPKMVPSSVLLRNSYGFREWDLFGVPRPDDQDMEIKKSV